MFPARSCAPWAAADLPALWTAPSTSHGDRKTLLRLFIRQVRITNLNDITFDIEIHWIGGAITRHTIFHPYGPARLARQLKAQGWDAGQIAEELKRRGARTMYRRKPFTAEHIEAIFRNDAKGRSPKNDKPWRRRREELRPILEELVQGSRLTDASVAAEFIRRGIPPFSPRRPWNKGMILRLRDALGIPSARSHNTQREGLRRIVTELCKVLPEDADIAAELERRGIPGLRGDGKWTEGRVGYLRARLGLQPRRGRLPGSSGNSTPAPSWPVEALRRDHSSELLPE